MFTSVYYDPRCNPYAFNNTVLVIGYGSVKSSGKDYWLDKNSRATNKGESGCIQLAQMQT